MVDCGFLCYVDVKIKNLLERENKVIDFWTHSASCRCPAQCGTQAQRSRPGAWGSVRWAGPASGACAGAWRWARHLPGCHTSQGSRPFAGATAASAPTTGHDPTSRALPLHRGGNWWALWHNMSAMHHPHSQCLGIYLWWIIWVNITSIQCCVG